MIQPVSSEGNISYNENTFKLQHTVLCAPPLCLSYEQQVKLWCAENDNGTGMTEKNQSGVLLWKEQKCFVFSAKSVKPNTENLFLHQNTIMV